MNHQRHTIIIKGMRVYAYHGVMEQERKVGGSFTIDAEVDADFSAAMLTDNLSDTISYADLHQLIRQEMAIPSQLLEHVAGRIADTIFKHFPQSEAIRLRIMKENPPMGADCQGAGVEIFVENRKQN
ncbi:MAG: dihydroneopterin aldolase [Bacteroidaceae bacterium]|nr:dihydroneopterin aldolase [Bacteroidaceae bacterium]